MTKGKRSSTINDFRNMCAWIYLYLICFVLDSYYQSSGCQFYVQKALLKVLSAINHVQVNRIPESKGSMNSALYKACVPMIVTIKMAINIAAVVDKREIIYEFKSDSTIYWYKYLLKTLHGNVFPEAGTFD